MKTIITEEKLNRVITESIKKILVNEGFFDSMFMHEKDEKDSEEKEIGKSGEKRRQRVIARLKDDGVDVAQYAYKLWPEKDEDSARSYFYKCLNGEKNDSGVVYKFDDDEINRLYSMLSNDTI